MQYLHVTMWALVVFVGCATLPDELAAQTTEVIAITGDPAPEGNGSFLQFGNPVLNDAGQVAFTVSLTDSIGGEVVGNLLVRGDGEFLTQIARTGDPTPDGSGSLLDFSNYAINEVGQVAFIAGTGGGRPQNQGIFSTDGSVLKQIIHTGQAAPDANGNFTQFGTFAFNNSGQAAFIASLIGTTEGGADNAGVFRGDGATLTQIAREGQSTPDGNGVFSDFFSTVALNDMGQAGFTVVLGNTSGGNADNSGIFQGNGATLLEIVRKGDDAPDGDGNITTLSTRVLLNDSGNASFLSLLSDTMGGSADNEAIFRTNNGFLTQVAREGQAIPNGNGSLAAISDNNVLNNAGRVAFVGLLASTSDENVWGLFQGDGGALHQIARTGQSAPDGNGVFDDLNTNYQIALNDAGQIVFPATFSATANAPSDTNGFFFYDEALGLFQIARTGDNLLGSTITSVVVEGGQDEHNGFNESGQVTYHFELADGREGIAIWTLPEPTTLTLLLPAVIALGRRPR